jgi:sec-independent protein translocase protein TatC
MRPILRLLWRFITAPFRLILWLLRKFARGLRNTAREIRDFFLYEEEDTPLNDAVSAAVANPTSILEHLDALRKHIFRGLIALVITSAISIGFTRSILVFLARPLPGGIDTLRSITVTENFGTSFRVALLAGFAMAFPYIALELWMFVAPGLRRRARLWGLFSIPIATLFLVGGMAFSYFVLLPPALRFLTGFMGIETNPRPAEFYNFVTNLMFWIGIFFEFPLVIFLLAKVGLVRASQLARQWRIAIVVIAILAAVVTPTPDPANMSLVMAPMIVLYFLSIGLAFLARREKPQP